jgi:hypothetical protein
MLAVRTAWGFSLSCCPSALIGEPQCLGTVYTLKAALPALKGAAWVDMISAAYSKNMRRARDGLNKKQASGYACYVVLTFQSRILIFEPPASASGKRCQESRLPFWRAAPSCCGDTARASSPEPSLSLEHNTHTTSTISLGTLHLPLLWPSTPSANSHPPSSPSITQLPRHT